MIGIRPDPLTGGQVPADHGISGMGSPHHQRAGFAGPSFRHDLKPCGSAEEITSITTALTRSMKKPHTSGTDDEGAVCRAVFLGKLISY